MSVAPPHTKLKREDEWVPEDWELEQLAARLQASHIQHSSMSLLDHLASMQTPVAAQPSASVFIDPPKRRKSADDMGCKRRKSADDTGVPSKRPRPPQYFLSPQITRLYDLENLYMSGAGP